MRKGVTAMLIPYLYLTGAALGVGIMAILRRFYQKNVGSSLVDTLFFSFLSSSAAFLIGFLLNGGFAFEWLTTLFALGYAGLSTVTAILCIVASKYGSASRAILYGSMGTLVLPSCFGLLFDPSDTLNPAKVLGFLFALGALLVGFRRQTGSDTDSRQMKRLQLAIFFTNGLALVVFKLMNMLRPGFSQSAFVTQYMLLSAAATGCLLLACLITGRKTASRAMLQKARRPAVLLTAAVYAAAFYLSDSFSMKCTALIPLTIQAPLSFCLPILCTAALEYFIYRQKLEKYDLLQIVFAIFCSVCFVFG